MLLFPRHPAEEVDLPHWFSLLTTSVHSPGPLWALIAALMLVESVVLDSCSDTLCQVISSTTSRVVRVAALNDNKNVLAAAGDVVENLIELCNARLASDGEHPFTRL